MPAQINGYEPEELLAGLVVSFSRHLREKYRDKLVVGGEIHCGGKRQRHAAAAGRGESTSRNWRSSFLAGTARRLATGIPLIGKAAIGPVA
jgi:hypothetical protein